MTNYDGSENRQEEGRGDDRRPARSGVTPLLLAAEAVLFLIVLVIVIHFLGGRGTEDAGKGSEPNLAQTLVTPEPTPVPTAAPAQEPTPAPSSVPEATAAPVPESTPAPSPAPESTSTTVPEPAMVYTREGILRAAEAREASSMRPTYVTVSYEDGTKLQVPEEKDFLDPPLEKIVYSDNPNSKYIQIMPKPQANHGVLGLMDKGEKVMILAEAGGFYFFVAEDGRAGWNGKSFFSAP